jgi:hypothetical protein
MTTPQETCGSCSHLTACEQTFGRVIPCHPEWTTLETLREESIRCRYYPSRWADARYAISWHLGRQSA